MANEFDWRRAVGQLDKSGVIELLDLAHKRIYYLEAILASQLTVSPQSAEDAVNILVEVKQHLDGIDVELAFGDKREELVAKVDSLRHYIEEKLEHSAKQ